MACTLHLTEELRRARHELLASVQGLFQHLSRSHPTDEAWAIVEILSHVSEADRHYWEQARAILQDPNHEFIYFDIDRYDLDHVAPVLRPPREVLGDMAETRARLLDWVMELSPEELERTGRGPRGAPMTVRQALHRLADHDRRHTKQILSFRVRMGAR